MPDSTTEISQEAARQMLEALRDFATLDDEMPPPGIIQLAWQHALGTVRAAIRAAEGRCDV